MVRAKFKCTSITKPYEGAEAVQLDAVYAEEGVNKQWSQYTPAGQLSLTITNPDAQGRFTQGKEYILDIREAQEGE